VSAEPTFAANADNKVAATSTALMNRCYTAS